MAAPPGVAPIFMKQVKLTLGFFALVDDKHFERVSQFKWYASIESRGTKIYAKRRCRVSEREKWRTQCIRLHHFILDWMPKDHPGMVIDHDDDDGLNCQEKNLIEMTQEKNMEKVINWRRKGVKVSEPFL